MKPKIAKQAGALRAVPPELLFVLSGTTQYAGATIAISLFDRVEPQTVAWLRLLGGATTLAVVAAVAGGAAPPKNSRPLALLAVFGAVIAAMNTSFYLAIDRVHLGKSVTIEFVGPIAVAVATTRSARNAIALTLAVAGVVVLGGVEVGSGNTVGLAFILVASACWAAYIVVGRQVARMGYGVSGLAISLALGTVAFTPIGAPASGPVWTAPHLLALALTVGVLSNAVAYGLDQINLRRIPVRRFSLLLALLPVTASLMGWLMLGQQPSPLDATGIALVIAGVALQDRAEVD